METHEKHHIFIVFRHKSVTHSRGVFYITLDNVKKLDNVNLL